MSTFKDILPPELIKDRGAIHPINHMKDSIMSLLTSLGFEIIDGPEIETEEFNFDMLNIKKSHPARQMHDTFYVQNKSNLLRTHTSPVQIRGMLEKKPPLAFISGGKVYRKDDDATHLPMFHQVEGIYVDENIFDNFVDAFKAQTEKYILNDPLDDSTNLGPVVKLNAATSIRNQVSKAISNGAKNIIDQAKFKIDNSNKFNFVNRITIIFLLYILFVQCQDIGHSQLMVFLL